MPDLPSRAGELMLPLSSPVVISAESTIDEALGQINGGSYLLVASADDGRIVGAVTAIELARLRQREGEDARVGEALQPTALIAAATSTRTALKHMRRAKNSLAVVLDEYGRPLGLVSRQALERGEPQRSEQPLIKPLPGGMLRAAGETPLELLRRRGLRIDHHYNSLSGLIVGTLGRVAQPGEWVQIDGWNAVVDEVDGTRIVTVILSQGEPSHPEEG